MSYTGLLIVVATAATIGLQPVSSCQTLVPAELLNGCIFDALTITVPTTSFTIARDSCNDVVDKEEFQEQPYVYFGNANEVSIM